MLRVEHLTKKYGKQVVLDDYSLHIEQGSIACLVGENGAGKTTLIKCCCGGLHFQSGQIWLDGVSVKQDMIEYKRKLAYIPDNPELYEYMTGIEYLNYVCDVYKISEKVRRAEFDRYCEMTCFFFKCVVYFFCVLLHIEKTREQRPVRAAINIR